MKKEYDATAFWLGQEDGETDMAGIASYYDDDSFEKNIEKPRKNIYSKKRRKVALSEARFQPRAE